MSTCESLYIATSYALVCSSLPSYEMTGAQKLTRYVARDQMFCVVSGCGAVGRQMGTVVRSEVFAGNRRSPRQPAHQVAQLPQLQTYCKLHTS